MELELKDAFTILKLKYKSHLRAAKAVGYSATHYRAIRNNRVPISKRTEQMILAFAEDAKPLSSKSVKS